MKESYPLQWPFGWERTPAINQTKGQFQVKDFKLAFNGLAREIRLLSDDENPYLTHNMMASQREPDDTGVAVYFTYEGRQVCIPCDKYDKVKNNIRGIEKTIEALRGIQRWGCKVVMERTVHAYTVPMLTSSNWRAILRLPEKVTLLQVEKQYKALAKENHPDQGGSPEQMAEINQAVEQARRELM